MNNPIFRGFKLPAAKARGRVPIFLDFSLDWLPEDYAPSSILNTVAVQAFGLFDGVILSSRSLLDFNPIQTLEIWGRVDQPSISTGTDKHDKDFIMLKQCVLDLLQAGASGMVGSLVLGMSAPHEADNIQELALLRSLSLEIGLPLAIDVHVSNPTDNNDRYLDIVEMGLNLAVELGCDAIIIPGGKYLDSDNHLQTITELPVLIRQSASSIKEHLASRIHHDLSVPVNGVVLANPGLCDQIESVPAIIDIWVKSSWLQPSGE